MSYKSPIELANKIEKPVTIRNKETFFDRPFGSEEADDVLFALQAYYGNPKLDYEEAAALFNPEEAEKAINWVNKKGYNKFTYFNK